MLDFYRDGVIIVSMSEKIRTESEVLADLKVAEGEENRQYWAFTRTARGKPVDSAVCRRVHDLREELLAIRRDDAPSSQATPLATSRRMTFAGHDTAALAKFRAAQKRQALKLGKTERESDDFAAMMCDMYGHQFRVWK